jgi:hypothetical protein
MSNNKTNDNIEPFHVFNYTQNAGSKCVQAMDTPTRSNQSDAETTELCCNELKCLFCWPLYLLFDILSCPFRGCIHLKSKCSNNSS